MNPIRILIADDQTLMRDGLKTILELEDDMEVVGTAENGLQAYEMAMSLRPDIVLMDIRMPVMDGVESTRLIKSNIPSVIIVVLTTFSDDEYIVQALSYGASGYLLKDIPGDRLIQSVRDGYAGNMLMPSVIAAKLANRISSLNSELVKQKNEISNDNLSERENEIAVLMAQGLTNRQIADKLCISEGTVKNYISMIYGKIGTSNRAKAMLYLKKRD